MLSGNIYKVLTKEIFVHKKVHRALIESQPHFTMSTVASVGSVRSVQPNKPGTVRTERLTLMDDYCV